MRRERYDCPKCGTDKGLLIAKKIKGVSPQDRPCKRCRNKVVAIKNKGKTAWNKGIPQTEAAKEKLRVAFTGKQAWNKGMAQKLSTRIKLSCINRGISIQEFDNFTTPINEAERVKIKKTNIRQECFTKADFTCECCKKRGRKLNAHHRQSWKFYPEQRANIDNLICLCEDCHNEFHKIYGSGVKEPNTNEQILDFIRSK